jgi:hypothetical protein
MGYRMSLEIHFMELHLDIFPTNLGAVTDEHVECFHLKISMIEKQYQGK